MNANGDLRLINQGDLPAIIELTVQVRNEAYLAFVPSDHVDDFIRHNTPSNIGSKLMQYAARPGSIGYVVLQNNKIVAYILGNDIDLSLSYLFVAKEVQGSGVGGRLFDTFLERNQLPYTLKVVEANAKAIAMYKRHGFRKKCRIVKPYFGMTKIAMERMLPMQPTAR